MKKFVLNKAGVILFSVLGGLLILIIIAVPIMAWSANEFFWTTRSLASLRALNLADAGAELAIWEIVHNNAQFTGWSGVSPKTLTLSSFEDNFGETIGDITVSAENTTPDHYFIVSVGSVCIRTSTVVTKTVKVKVFPHPLFNNGVFGDSSVEITGGASIDSYPAGGIGDVGTNGTLTVSGTGTVDGDVFVGPNGDIVGDIPSHVSGEDYYSGNEVELEDAPFDSAYFTSLPAQASLSVSGGPGTVETILTGDYYYDSIGVDGQAILIINSNTRIYIENNFFIAGQAEVNTGEGVEFYIGGNGDFAGQGIVNTTGVPGNLIIYGVGSGTSLSFTGQSDFYGAVYAPGSSIYMAGGAEYFGSVVGDSIELAGGIEFHFDESLLSGGPFIGYDIAYWQEN